MDDDEAHHPQNFPRTLDTLRLSLSTLRASLDALLRSLSTSDPLPPWPTLEFNMGQVNMQLSSVFEHLQSHSQILSAAHVYPTPGFPGSTHATMLAELLRKKMEVGVEEWVDEGRRVGVALNAPPPAAESQNDKSNGRIPDGHDGQVQQPLSDVEIEELWEWAAPAGNEVARSILFPEDEGSEAGTPMEGVSTPGPGTGGKARSQQAVRPMMPLEEVLRFVSLGVQGGPGGVGR